VRRADNLTTFMRRLSSNLGASTSWNPRGLSRLVMGLLNPYLFITSVNYTQNFIKIVLSSLTTPNADEIMGIIGVDFDTRGQLLIIYFAFVKYLRKNGNTMK